MVVNFKHIEFLVIFLKSLDAYISFFIFIYNACKSFLRFKICSLSPHFVPPDVI